MPVLARSLKQPLLLALLTGECVRFNHEGQHRFHSLDGWRGRVLPQRSEKFPRPSSLVLVVTYALVPSMMILHYSRQELAVNGIFLAKFERALWRRQTLLSEGCSGILGRHLGVHRLRMVEFRSS